ncbi:ABC transporter permease [Lachnoclostridium sp. An118]|uniref:ABC transporter permease n=1 Tax=Lachnoclostridium sp. An118 TaxID=1965547 RepID=UPI00117A6B8D|nr:ABC transporter permease [Lachnoclostridium sp. An118]
MKIIWKVLTKEIRQRPGRFLVLAAGMTLAVFLITATTVFSTSCLQAMIRQEKRENGPYEAIFHHLTEEQASALSGSSCVRQVWTLESCPEETAASASAKSSDSDQVDRVCCGVSFRRISLAIFENSQKVGEEIGMDALPLEEQPVLYARANHMVTSAYDITFNNKLLGYYGVNASGTAAGSAWAILLLDFVIALFGAALLYYVSLSGMEEKLKITGLLDGIGISEGQKLCFAFGENLLAGCVAIPAGILLGIAALAFSIRWLGDRLFPVEDMEISVNPLLLLAVLSGTVLLALSSAQGLYDRLRKESVLNLISGYDNEEEINRTAVLLGVRRHFFKAETLLAVKNVIMYHKNYCVSSVLLVIALCVLLNGTMYVEGLTSPPATAGQSLPPVSLWASAKGGDGAAFQEAAEALGEIEGIDTVSVVKEAKEYSALAGMDLSEIEDYLSEIHGTNALLRIQSYEEFGESLETMLEDSCLRRVVRVIGVDDSTFRRLLGDGAEGTENGAVPENKGAVLESNDWSMEEGDDSEFPLFIQGERSNLPILRTISKADRPILFPDQLVTADSLEDAPLSFTDGDAILYIPLQTFDELMADYQDTSLSLEIILSRDRGARRNLTEILYPDNAASRMKEDSQVINSIRKHLEGIELESLTVYSFAGEYQESFFIGGKGAHVLLVAALVSTVWIASILITLQRDVACIRRRKREFALLQSIGMPTGRIFKMVFLEHLTFAFAGVLAGIPLSLFILSGLYTDGGAPQMRSPLDVSAQLVGVQLILTAFVVLVPFLYTVRELRRMDMIDVIRKEEA